MTKGQTQLFEKIERGVKAGALTVIETAKRSKTPIVISCPDGKIRRLTPAQAQKELTKSQKVVNS
ncbi:MAG: hypothetical protein JW812_02395 [Alphaproteobacteria bacterium]|nr:hypothetical protein [Alphaproteobacteria bacterium]MBN2780271.1 hypothetical protein [Alphaproteobacteria bacterium]